MERTFTETIADLRMLLRDQRPCTTADLTDCAVAYLSGDEVRGVFLNCDGPDGLDELFVVDAWFVGQVEDSLAEWFERPRFTHRPALCAWALNAPLAGTFVQRTGSAIRMTSEE